MQRPVGEYLDFLYIIRAPTLVLRTRVRSPSLRRHDDSGGSAAPAPALLSCLRGQLPARRAASVGEDALDLAGHMLLSPGLARRRGKYFSARAALAHPFLAAATAAALQPRAPSCGALRGLAAGARVLALAHPLARLGLCV